MEHLGGIPEGHVNRPQLGWGRAIFSAPISPISPRRSSRRRLYEEVEQRRLLAGPGHEHVSARAESRQQLLGRERGQHRPHRRIDRVAAFPQHSRTGLGSQRVPRSHHSLLLSRAHASEA